MPVNPLLPDEQIVHSFTEEERTFYDWYTANIGMIHAMQHKPEEFGMFSGIKVREDAWPDPETRNRYWEWERAWRRRERHRMKLLVLQPEFFDKISATNFGSVSSRAEHLWMMEMLNTPWCLLGESDFGGVLTGYAMEPGPAYLWPNYENENDLDLVHRNILAINTNVRVEGEFTQRQGSTIPTTQASPQKRRRMVDSSGGDTVRSAHSDDADRAGGFLFVQLGSLYAYSGAKPWAELRTLERGAIIRGPWVATGFGVVLEIDSRGRQGPVWVMYNFHTIGEDDKHYHIPIMEEGGITPFPHIGRLTAACDRTFTIAKIADSVAELKNESAKIDFKVEAVVEFQIVRVKACTSTGMPLIRQFVKAD